MLQALLTQLPVVARAVQGVLHLSETNCTNDLVVEKTMGERTAMFVKMTLFPVSISKR